METATNKEKPTQEELETFVKNNIGPCQSMLIEQLIRKELEEFQFDNIVNLYAPITRERVLMAMEMENDEEDYKKLEAMSWEDLQNQCDLEIDEMEDNERPQEIFEWWIIDEWMAEKLEAQGEPVLKNCYGNWWGRTTTGQAISLDYVIEEIYTSLN